ncbi:MAG: hypothetical protein E6Q97_08960 [Desulfurellales bacterium]|nr:MAG: hypothetical protein E6Q97_08960 [Desulfurellales bacterium]
MTRTIETDDFRTPIEPGMYVAKTQATVYLSHGKGDSRRDMSFTEYNAGDTFEIPRTVNEHWYGLEPNGDMFAPKPAIIEAVTTVDTESFDRALREVAEIVYAYRKPSESVHFTKDDRFRDGAKANAVMFMARDWKQAADMAAMWGMIDSEIDEHCSRPENVKAITRQRFAEVAAEE